MNILNQIATASLKFFKTFKLFILRKSVSLNIINPGIDLINCRTIFCFNPLLSLFIKFHFYHFSGLIEDTSDIIACLK